MKLFIPILFVFFSFQAFNQEYDYVSKQNKHISFVSKNDLTGMTYNKKLVLPIQYSFISKQQLGFTYYSDSLAGYTDLKGNILLECPCNDIVDDDDHDVLIAINLANEYAVFDRSGKNLVPFGKHEPVFLETGILVLAGDYSSMINYDGTVMIPYGLQQIEPMDYYGRILNVKNPSGEGKLWLNENFSYPNLYEGVNQHFFASQLEISIADYFLFVSSQKTTGMVTDQIGNSIPYSDLLPDTNFVEPKLRKFYKSIYPKLAIEEGREEFSSGRIEYNGDHFLIELPYKLSKEERNLSYFPVTGISLQQAKWYTNWLSDMYNEYFVPEYGYTFKFRLPTETEWNELAEDGLPEAMKKNHVTDSVNFENCMLFIYSNLPKCKGYESYVKASLGSGTVPVIQMNADDNNLYQVFGNVSELTSEKGISKGGNYTLPANQAATSKRQLYTGPQPWLGFRVIGEYRM